MGAFVVLLVLLDEAYWLGSGRHAEEGPDTGVDEGQEDATGEVAQVGLAPETRSDDVVESHTFPPGAE